MGQVGSKYGCTVWIGQALDAEAMAAMKYRALRAGKNSVVKAFMCADAVRTAYHANQAFLLKVSHPKCVRRPVETKCTSLGWEALVAV